MLASITSLLVVVSSFLNFQSVSNEKIPADWTNDFTITLSFTGSMDGSSTHVTFTHDSVKYEHVSSHHFGKNGSSRLTEQDRTEILSKLKEMRADKLHSEMTLAAVNDGWSTLICLGSNCTMGGTSAEMTERERALFQEVYQFLEDFAWAKVMSDSR